MRKPRNRNTGQRILPQQISKQLDAQMKNMPFECGFAVGKDAMKRPLGDAEFSGKRRRRPGAGDICPEMDVDQTKQPRTGELMAGAGGKTQQGR